MRQDGFGSISGLLETMDNKGGFAVPIRCLVLEPVPLVAEDLALLIEECRAGTSVVLTATLTQAEAALEASGGCDIAFLNIDPERFAGTSLAKSLERTGVSVVFLGHEVEAARVAQRYLERPFLGSGVLGILEMFRPGRRWSDPTG
jgi:hypothetical protein